MNGAMAELCARMSKTPKTNSTTIMGSIHQRLLPQRKVRSSPAIPKRLIAILKKPIRVGNPCQENGHSGQSRSNCGSKKVGAILLKKNTLTRESNTYGNLTALSVQFVALSTAGGWPLAFPASGREGLHPDQKGCESVAFHRGPHFSTRELSITKALIPVQKSFERPHAGRTLLAPQTDFRKY